MEDMVAKSRQARGEGVGNVTLTESDVIAIREELAKGGIKYGELAKKYGVDTHTIYSINIGGHWRHLLPEDYVPADGYIARGEEHGRAILTEDQVRQVRQLCASGLFPNVELAEMFNVSASTIGDIKKRRSWKHLEDEP
jgi:hypothetical protein